MTFKLQGKDVKVISGYFLAIDDQVDSSGTSKESDDESDDDDGNNDEFDSVDFSDDKAFSPETHVVKPKSELLKVRFKEYGSGMVHEIHGHFPLTDPWWCAKLQVRRHQLIAICGYWLRNDKFIAEEKVLMLFLNACSVHEDHRTAFEEFLRHFSSHGLTFENLLDRLAAFAIDNKEIAKQIQERVKRGGPVQNALRFHRLYEILPQLLPKHFVHISGLDDKILDDLENALSVQPWAFGFSSILTRYYSIHGCEASFKNFYHCSEVYSRLSDTEKDGLFIYEALKDMCRREGHTFVEFRSLKTWAEWKMNRNRKNDCLKYTVVDWNKGLFFLEAQRIVVLDVHQSHSKHLSTTQSWRQKVKSDTRIYLSRFYFAERDIASNLETLMFHEKFLKWNVEIDFESKHFERLRTDKDQMKAAELIAMKPVVVLSGKGGCGKTEVVGRVFSYAREASAQECLFSQCSITDEKLVENADEQMSLYYATNKQHDLDCNGQESLSTSNCALGNGDSNQTSAALEVNSREKESIVTLPPTQNGVKCEEMESIVTLPPILNNIKYEEKESTVSLPPTQNYIKCEEKESSVTLGGTQDLGSCRGNDLTEIQGNSTASALENHIDRTTILLTAPTGKAAILLGRRSGMPGYTLHQVVYSYFAWKRNLIKEEQNPWKQDPWKFASVRVLIVDECSLVPVTIFQRVLSALLTDAQLSKVVLLGDINQLPSIEPGRFLADVYEALEDAGCSITLRTNHRSESQFIVENAERILQQQLPIIDPHQRFHQINLAGNDRDSEDNNRDVAVRKLLKEDILPGHEKSQFVAFRRRDCDGINELCCKHYNNHTMKKPSGKGKQVLDFRPGDKVCCTRNANVADYTDRDSSDNFRQRKTKGNGNGKEVPEIRLCNGEIFFIKSMNEVQEEQRGKTICYVVLSDLEREIRVSLRELKNFCKLKHAWARTIHTFQGSETDALVYVVGSAGSYQNWQHVYTAVTRGKQQVHILTQPSCLYNAVKQKPIQRSTSLKERLQVMIAKQLPQRGQPLIQEESRNTDVIPSAGTKSAGETSTLNDSSLDEGPDFVTPVKASPPRNQDAKSISGGKRKHPDPSAVMDGSPSVKCAKENSLADSLLSPIRRQLSLNNV